MNSTNGTTQAPGAASDNSAPMQRILDLLLEDNRRREKSQRRDTWFKRIALAALILFSIYGYYSVLRNLLGTPGASTEGPSIAVVNVRGAIMPSSSSLASASRVVQALQKAAEDENVKKIILHIESPGGAPVEAERIMQAVQSAREEHKKPVVAVIGTLGASAAYMVALSADEIVSGKYSLVGSIGAVIQTWDVHGLLQRYDVRSKSFASGDLKTLGNPFEPQTEQGAQKAQRLVDTMGTQFAELVAEKRKGKLTQELPAYTSGEVWNGEEALKLGLVDATGTLESVAAQTPELKLVDFGPREPINFMSQITGAIQSGVAQGVATLAQPQGISVH